MGLLCGGIGGGGGGGGKEGVRALILCLFVLFVRVFRSGTHWRGCEEGSEESVREGEGTPSYLTHSLIHSLTVSSYSCYYFTCSAFICLVLLLLDYSASATGRFLSMTRIGRGQRKKATENPLLDLLACHGWLAASSSCCYFGLV